MSKCALITSARTTVQELTARAVRAWLGRVGANTLYIEPGSPWENGYVESVNAKLRDEVLDRDSCHTQREAQVLTYKGIRPHGSLGYRPLAPTATRPAEHIPTLVELKWQTVPSLGAGQGDGRF